MIIFVGLCAYWVKNDLLSTIGLVILFISSFTIAFMLTELYTTWNTKQIRRNRWILMAIVLVISITVSFIYFNWKMRYWSIVLGGIVFGSVYLGVLFSKIKFK